MQIAVIGCGYVGLVTAAGLAEFGHTVVGIDKDQLKIEVLNKGRIPIFEAGLANMTARNRKAKRLRFVTNLAEGLENAQVIYITVGTPSRADGSVELSQIEATATEIAANLKNYAVIVNKSTVPVGTAKYVRDLIMGQRRLPVDFDIVSNPEFLREGAAVRDFMKPDRIVIGTDSVKAQSIMIQVYQKLYNKKVPFILSNPETAELIKYASNAFLATKVTFINEFSHLCEAVGADIKKIALGMGLDQRIGPNFLSVGPGYGGSCFPKDTEALIQIARDHGVQACIVETVVQVNKNHQARMVEKIKGVVGNLTDKIIAILGLAFKADTDDVRESPAIPIIAKLINSGAKIKAHDPQALAEASKIFQDQIQYCTDQYQAASGADALVVITDWNSYRHLDWERLKREMKKPVIIDLRNIFNPQDLIKLGFVYEGIGI